MQQVIIKKTAITAIVVEQSGHQRFKSPLTTGGKNINIDAGSGTVLIGRDNWCN